MWGMLDIPTSGMIAQRTRLEAIASNIANINTVEDAAGNYSPYLRRAAEFAAGDPNAGTARGRAMGVHVSSIAIDQNALRLKHDPTSRFADGDGNVMVPDIDPIIEQVNAMAAGRGYEANVAAAEALKATMAQALRLLA